MKNKKNNKVIFVLIGFLMLLSSSFFVFPVGASSEPKTSQTVILNIVVTSEQKASILGVIPAFLSSSYGAGISDVNVISSGDTADDQLTYIQTRLAAGDTTLDVIGLDVIYTALFVENGWLENLDSYLEAGEMDAYVGGMVDSGKYQGSQWAYPYFFNLGVLFYREDLLTAYGYDETDIDTWAELNATANDILAQENDPDLVGYVAQFDNYEGGTVNFQEWIGSNGATTIFDSEGKPTVNSAEAIEALAFLKALVAPAADTNLATTDYIIDRDALIYNEGTSEAKWSAGEAIFCRQWPYVYSITIANSLLNHTDGMGDYDQFGVVGIPTFTGAVDEKSSCVGGAILGISALSAHKDAAFNLTKWLCLNESQYYALETYGHFPALKETFTTLPAGYEYVYDFYLASDVTLARPKHPDYPDISDAISDRFTEIISCQKSATEGLNDLQQDIIDIITPVPDVAIPGILVSTTLLVIASMLSVIILLNRKKFKH